jgi:prevent-host-death family protein
MSVVKIADLKNNLSRHLARVRRGGELVVYDRATPVARIVPFDPESAGSRSPAGRHAAAARVADLARQGLVAPGDPGAFADWATTHDPIERPAGSPSAVELLLDMRRKSER